jgi:hypothetical protein
MDAKATDAAVRKNIQPHVRDLAGVLQLLP